MKVAILFPILLVLVLAGCSSQTTIKYQCADGSFVDSVSLCSSKTCPESNCPQLDCASCPVKTETKVEIKTATNTVYVCSDLREVKNKDDCLKADSEGWYEVKTFNGAGQRKTEPFQINSKYWRYLITCKEDPNRNAIEEALYHLDVYKISEEEPKFINRINYQKCSYNNSPNYIYEGLGRYYFDMRAYNIEYWSIKVEAIK